MNQKQALDALDVLINAAGVDTSNMETAVLELDQTDPKVVALRKAIETHGDEKLAPIQAWATAQRSAPQEKPVVVVQHTAPGLPPGMTVADVGGDPSAGLYHGPQNPLALTLENWAYFANHRLGGVVGEIFDRPYRIGDPSIGADHLYAAGDLATAQEDPQVPGGVNLRLYG